MSTSLFNRKEKQSQAINNYLWHNCQTSCFYLDGKSKPLSTDPKVTVLYCSGYKQFTISSMSPTNFERAVISLAVGVIYFSKPRISLCNLFYFVESIWRFLKNNSKYNTDLPFLSPIASCFLEIQGASISNNKQVKEAKDKQNPSSFFFFTIKIRDCDDAWIVNGYSFFRYIPMHDFPTNENQTFFAVFNSRPKK
jgi:hypothetical protein